MESHRHVRWTPVFTPDMEANGDRRVRWHESVLLLKHMGVVDTILFCD